LSSSAPIGPNRLSVEENIHVSMERGNLRPVPKIYFETSIHQYTADSHISKAVLICGPFVLSPDHTIQLV
jgi:hypothetical protein